MLKSGSAFFSFAEFLYEGKKLAAYAEEMPTTIYLHMETLKKVGREVFIFVLTIRNKSLYSGKQNNLLEYWKEVVKFINNIAEKGNKDANYSQRSWWHQSSTLRSDYALPETNIGKRTTGPHWDGVALVRTVLCQKGGTLPLKTASSTDPRSLVNFRPKVACSDVTKSTISQKNFRRISKKNSRTMSNCCMRRSAKFHVDSAVRF